MTRNRITVREARKSLSKTLAEGRTVSIGDNRSTLRGFIVGVKPHNRFIPNEKKKALSVYTFQGCTKRVHDPRAPLAIGANAPRPSTRRWSAVACIVPG
jgi:hypothetical protein